MIIAEYADFINGWAPNTFDAWRVETGWSMAASATRFNGFGNISPQFIRGHCARRTLGTGMKKPCALGKLCGKKDLSL